MIPEKQINEFIQSIYMRKLETKNDNFLTEQALFRVEFDSPRLHKIPNKTQYIRERYFL